MQFRVRTQIRPRVWKVQSETYPGAGWVTLCTTELPDAADYLVRAADAYELARLTTNQEEN